MYFSVTYFPLYCVKDFIAQIHTSMKYVILEGSRFMKQRTIPILIYPLKRLRNRYVKIVRHYGDFVDSIKNTGTEIVNIIPITN